MGPLFYQPDIGNSNYLDADESKHVRAMRRRVGDLIEITDGKGLLVEARIASTEPQRCEFEIVRTHTPAQPAYQIHIAISPLSHPDRLEWFVEKAVELGITRITLARCERTEKRHVKIDRLTKLAIGAMKQSRRLILPGIEGPYDLDSIVSGCSSDERFIAFVDASNPRHLFNTATSGRHYTVLIGPEGDFTNPELQQALDNRFVKVSLGTHRLRTETAGIVACDTLNLVNTR